MNGVTRLGTIFRPTLILVLFLSMGCSSENEGFWADPPEMAPKFVLETLTSDFLSLEDLRGNTVVLDFWATWCSPCVRQVPVFNKFMDMSAKDGVSVIGVSVDAKGWEVVRPFVEEHQVRYTILLGDESLAQKFGALGFPATFIISPKGKISSAHFGVISLSELESAVRQVDDES